MSKNIYTYYFLDLENLIMFQTRNHLFYLLIIIFNYIDILNSTVKNYFFAK